MTTTVWKFHLCKPKNNTYLLYFAFTYFLHCNRYLFWAWNCFFFDWLIYFLVVIDHCEEKLALRYIVNCDSICETIFLKNHAQNVVEKLVPGLFSENLKLSISLEQYVYVVGCPNILKLSSRPLAFTSS